MKIAVKNFDNKPVREIELPELGTVSRFHGKPTDDEAFFGFTSFLRPLTVYRYGMNDGAQSVFTEPCGNTTASLQPTSELVVLVKSTGSFGIGAPDSAAWSA